MLDCSCLIHPFQNDPGTSQRQRIMDELLSGATKIDARTLADLLDYFVQLSRHINYYDLDMTIGDWQPFFKNSVPFTLASIIKYQHQNVDENFSLYNSFFERKPSATGLQLNAFFLYYRFINKINEWHLTLKDSGLPLESDIEVMIGNKLREPVLAFIKFANAAVKSYGMKRIDFTSLSQNKAWNIDLTDLYAIDTSFSAGTKNKFKRINNLYNDFKSLFPVLLDSVKTLSIDAEKNLEQSFIPLKEELQKRHQPHLALLFAFLNMFRQLQDDLNKYTRKHLDFFYKDILQFKSAEAVADKTHIVFEIQKQLKNYLVKKGIKVKDGKDNNKQEILFSLDDDIVVTKTAIADKRTLFLNNQDAYAETYVEGVYMAPVAEKADGVDQDFADDPKNFPTLGAQYSKYIDPETKLIKPYPNARLGFILGSPVLFLQAGSTRTININLDCYLEEQLCSEIITALGVSKQNCCNDANPNGPAGEEETYPEFYLPHDFFTDVNNTLANTYYYFNQDLLKQAIKKGISKDLVDRLRDKFLLEKNLNYDPTKPPDYCTNCPSQKDKYEGILVEGDYTLAFNPGEQEILAAWIKPRKALNILFSGEKEWVEPVTGKLPLDPLFTSNLSISMGALSFVSNKFRFTLTIKAVLTPDKPAVTFYDKEKLNEDFGTTQPVAKLELDDKIKLIDISLQGKATPASDEGCCAQSSDCCLLIEDAEDKHRISLYHFFRSVLVDQVANANKPVITVDVCGLKNFIVQNDESVMDVNGPVYPFGTRPDVPDFDVVNPVIVVPKNLVGPNFYIGSPEVLCKKWGKLFINIKWKDKPSNFNEYYKAYILRGAVFGLNEDDFQINIALFENGKWIAEDPHALPNPPPAATVINNGFNDRPLFKNDGSSGFCTTTGFDQTIFVDNGFFSGLDHKFTLTQDKVTKFDVNTRNGFLKINLQNQDFCHKNYSVVLARQMMALGRLPNELLTGAVYKDHSSNTVFVFSDAFLIIDNLETKVGDTETSAILTESDANHLINMGEVGSINPAHANADATKTKAHDAVTEFAKLKALNSLFDFFTAANRDKLEALIPNEPWTPTISNISLDYEASANLEDIDLIHLYPYTGTYKQEEIELGPTLLPTFCDEGTLFLGLQDLVPGDNLNILFQLAEATSDSEADKEDVYWYYLDSNIWKPLRKGFEVIDDATKNLTTSGIVTLSLPANMTKDNTVMPKNLHWIKAAIAKNSRAVSETTAIIPQAILTTFTNDDANDKLRLAKPLVAGSISKLNEADASIKSVAQPYDSFNGAVPEIENQFYVRVSETLRHKGRAIQAFDYERLALQAFPQLFKVKCINHSFALNAHEYSNDFPYAPGYVTLAVIPDLYKLKAGNSFEPKVPVSIIEDIETYIRKRTSPFVRFRAMNPRYEKINFCLRVQLNKGKDENYFREQIKQDIKEFLAPWAVGKYDKLTFGQCIYRSDIIRLLETSDYVDFIADFRMAKENDVPDVKAVKICPDTPRSILIAGDIDVCIETPGCETWSTNYTKCGEQGAIVAPCDTKPEPIINYCK